MNFFWVQQGFVLTQIAYSSGHLTEMLKDLSEAASKRGLKIHPEKTKVLTNASKIKHTPVAKELPFHPKPIEVLQFSDDVKYLGCRFSFHQRTDVALNHRIAAAWASFSSHRKELTNKRYPLKCRLRLFDATVTANSVVLL